MIRRKEIRMTHLRIIHFPKPVKKIILLFMKVEGGRDSENKFWMWSKAVIVWVAAFHMTKRFLCPIALALESNFTHPHAILQASHHP